MKKRVIIFACSIAMILTFCVSGCSGALNDFISDIIPAIETALDPGTEPGTQPGAGPGGEPRTGSDPGSDDGQNAGPGFVPTDIGLPAHEGLEMGTLTLSAVSPGNLRADIEEALISEAGQSEGDLNFGVINNLKLTDESELGTADRDFLMDQLTGLTSLDLGGHIASFSVDFQNSQTLSAVRLPAEADLADSMFNGCSRLSAVLFMGNSAPEIGAYDFSGVSAVAYVTDPSGGGFEQEAFQEHFSAVQSIDPPAFTAQPSNQNADVGQSVTFTVGVTGAPEPSLQWQESVDGGDSWIDLSGQTGSSLSIESVIPDQNDNLYRALAASLAGNTSSDAAVLIVNSPGTAQIPNITTQPAGGTVFVSDVITLSVAASVTDGGTLSYQWYSNVNDSNTTGTLISGATTNTFTAPTSAAGTTFYYVIVTNTYNSQTAVLASNTARVTVNARVNAQTPNITAQPGSGAVSQNGTINLSVTAAVTDGGTLSYQWFSNTSNSNSGGAQISGATGASYAPPTDTVGDAYYYVTVTNTNNNASGATTATANSAVAKVTVNALVNALAPEIIDLPVGGKVVLDSKIMIIVSARVTDGGKLTYQWFSNEVSNNTGGTRIGGGTGDSYTPPTNKTGEMFYYVEITNTKDDATGEKTAKTVSEAVSVIVFTTPGAPLEVIAMPSNNEVLVSWKPPRDDGGSEITGYEVSDNGTSWLETTLDNRYLFTGVTGGAEYTFRVRALNDAGYGEEASVTVMVAEHYVIVTGVVLDKDYLDISVGGRAQLKATVFPEDADDKSVTWTSSNENVATVNDRGLVSALSKGFAIITVTTNDRRFTATCDVNVEDSSGPGGSVLLWLLLSTLVVAGGVGVYLWLRKRNARNARNKSGNKNAAGSAVGDAARGATGNAARGATRDVSRGVTNRDVSRDATMDVTGDLPVDEIRDITGDLTGDVTRGVTRGVARDATSAVTRDATSAVTRDEIRDITRDISRDVSDYLNSDVSFDVSGDISKDISRDVTKYLNNDINIDER